MHASRPEQRGSGIGSSGDDAPKEVRFDAASASDATLDEELAEAVKDYGLDEPDGESELNGASPSEG